MAERSTPRVQEGAARSMVARSSYLCITKNHYLRQVVPFPRAGHIILNAVDRVVGNAVVVLFARASTVAMFCIAPASAVARFGTEGQEAWGGRAGAGGPLFVQPPLRPGKQVVH